MTAVCEITVDFLELILFFVGMYYVLAGVFAFINKPDIPHMDKGARRFAVIIPAHNEAAVIGKLLKSIHAQNYPKGRIDVYVAADGCSDSTPNIASAYGAELIIMPQKCLCKAEVIRRAIEHIKNLCGNIEEKYDCIAFFDADNILSSDCILRMNDMLNCGYGAIQCRIEPKNPHTNWLTAAYSVWNMLEYRFGKMGSHNLGLGCKLSGTGFAIDTLTLKKCPWNCETIAEDLEYTMELGLNDIKAGFAKKAVVYDEKPSGFKTSVMQRLRWAQGIVDVQGKYSMRLLRKGKLTMWLSLYGDFLGQFTYILSAILSIFAAVSIAYGIDFPLCSFWTQPIAYVSLNIYLGLGALCAFTGFIIDKELNRHTIVGLFGFVLYMLSWIPIGVAGIFRHNKKEWYHTEHTG